MCPRDADAHHRRRANPISGRTGALQTERAETADWICRLVGKVRAQSDEPSVRSWVTWAIDVANRMDIEIDEIQALAPGPGGEHAGPALTP